MDEGTNRVTGLTEMGRYKQAEAADRLALEASGRNGAWPWPVLEPDLPNLIDDEWRYELELGGD